MGTNMLTHIWEHTHTLRDNTMYTKACIYLKSHTRTNIQIRADTQTQAHKEAYTDTPTPIQIHKNIPQTQTHAHMSSPMCVLTCVHAHTEPREARERTSLL